MKLQKLLSIILTVLICLTSIPIVSITAEESVDETIDTRLKEKERRMMEIESSLTALSVSVITFGTRPSSSPLLTAAVTL